MKTTLILSGLDLARGTCGEFLGRLVGRLQSALNYVRAADVPWLSALLGDFCEFEFESSRVASHVPRGRVGALPLDWLKLYARHWIQSEYLQSAAVQTLAISALQLADEHLFERDSPGRDWRVRGAHLHSSPLSEEHSHKPWFFDEARFKREFTQKNRGKLLAAEVPPGGRLEFIQSGMCLGEGSFDFYLHRFHLSVTAMSPGDDELGFRTHRPSDAQFDILDDESHMFVGVIEFNGQEYRGLVPVGWLKGEWRHGGLEQTQEFFPLPPWLGIPLDRAASAALIPAQSLDRIPGSGETSVPSLPGLRTQPHQAEEDV
ncbi:hypothetical protein [Myxococcus stipitatus]|uniref:hypothetical protein n=1 Tax=Myxococcus stipitatus TaxID=83455 RepID=UPI001186C0D9|nr:hypothetical protein [Myxococcus stipitatus]